MAWGRRGGTLQPELQQHATTCNNLQHVIHLVPFPSPLPAAVAPPRTRRLRIMPWQGLAHVLSVLITVMLARFAVFDVVQVGVI